MFVVFDLETTGFSSVSSDVIQLAYIVFDSNNMFVKAETLYFYYEGMSWSEDAYNVHHIPLDFLRKHKDKFRENLIKAYSVLNHANVIGHNSEDFDCPFIRNWLRRMGIAGLEFGVRNDTMKAYRPLTRKARIKLTALCRMMNITDDIVNQMTQIWFNDSGEFAHHNAAFDTTATALLTLRGIDRNLIAFAPMNRSAAETSGNSSINADTMLDMEDAKPIDPKRFLLELHDGGKQSETWYQFVNHDKNAYAETVPVGTDVNNMSASNLLFPVVLVRQDDSDNTYTCEHEGVSYVFVQGDSGDTFTMKTPYGEFTDNDVDISAIIRNNFKEKDGGA